MAHWKYLPMIATINKGLLDQKMSLSIIVVLGRISWTLLLRSLFCVKFINVAIVTQNWNNIRSNVCVSTGALLPTFLITKKSELSISAYFHKYSLIVACCMFGRFEIRTLTPNRFKNQTKTHWNYLATITIINEVFLNKKLSFSIVAVWT